MLNKFVIIGNSNTGKSGVLDQVIEDLSLRSIGFRMKDFTIEDEFRGYYIHSILPVEGYANNLPIQTSLASKKHRVNLTEVYDTFGVKCLQDVLSTDKDAFDIIVLDELGRGEATSTEFDKCIEDVLNSDNVVFILMKNISNPVTTQVKKRQDAYLYDLDNMSQDEVIYDIKDKVKKLLNK